MNLERLEVGWGTAAAGGARDARNGAEGIAALFRSTVTQQPDADPNRMLYPRRPQTALKRWAAIVLALAGCAALDQHGARVHPRITRHTRRVRPAETAPVMPRVTQTPPPPEVTQTEPDDAGCRPSGPGKTCMPGGFTQIGRAAGEGHFEERPAWATRLRAFDIDEEEVSAAAYAHCITTGSCAPAVCDDGTTPSLEGPARCIAWADARAYCSAAGGRLPTEAEWERTAAGLLPSHRAHPWGESADGYSPDASLDRTPDGVVGLGGSVAEWVEDVGGFYVVPSIPDAGPPDAGPVDTGDAGSMVQDASEASEHELASEAPEALTLGLPQISDARGPRDGPWRVVRGGDDRLPVTEWTSSRRRFRLPGDRRPWIGFRCVYDRVD